jgi:hypothetical protein
VQVLCTSLGRRGLHERHSAVDLAVSLAFFLVFSTLFLADFALRNDSETLQKRLDKRYRNALRAYLLGINFKTLSIDAYHGATY